MKVIFTLLIGIFICSNVHAQTKLWATCFTDSTSTYFTNDVAVDAGGNSYLAGYVQDPDNYLLTHYFLLKNNSGGALQWISYFPVADSFDVGTAVVADNNGNVYVTGQRYDTACNICTVTIPHSYAFTIKYNAAGSVVWLNRYDGPVATNQKPAEIAIDAKSFAYTTGIETKYNSSTGRSDQWMITQKINATGQTVWVKKITDGQGKAVTVDNAGAVIATGAYTPDGVYQLNNLITVKYKPNGDTAWYRKFAELNKNGIGYSVRTDGGNNVYVNGQTDTITYYNNPRIITLKYNTAGTMLWAQKESDHTYSTPGYYGGYTTDKNGNSYIAGYKTLSDVNDDWLVVKRNAAGKLLWNQQYDDSLHASDKPSGGIVVDAAGNVTASGYATFQRNTPFATIQYTPAGVLKWIAYYKRSARSYNYPVGMGIDAQSNIYVAGSMCVVKYATATTVSTTSQQEAKAISRPEGGISILPNPVKDAFLLQTNGLPAGKYSCSIYNLQGAAVYNNTIYITSAIQTNTINVGKLATGTYILRLSDGTHPYTKTFIKQ